GPVRCAIHAVAFAFRIVIQNCALSLSGLCQREDRWRGRGNGHSDRVRPGTVVLNLNLGCGFASDREGNDCINLIAREKQERRRNAIEQNAYVARIFETLSSGSISRLRDVAGPRLKPNRLTISPRATDIPEKLATLTSPSCMTQTPLKERDKNLPT